MVRLGLIVGVLVLAGCAALRDAFSAHAQVAGTAAGQTLTVDRLAHVIGHAQRIPIRPDVLTGVANVYLDYAVFATELGREHGVVQVDVRDTGEHVGSDRDALRASDHVRQAVDGQGLAGGRAGHLRVARERVS